MSKETLQADSYYFDYLFIGLGAANCLLISRMHESELFVGKKIGIIEPSGKTNNDQTFCFWATQDELVKLKLENLVSYRWNSLEVSGTPQQSIQPLTYFHIKSIDLYEEAKKRLSTLDFVLFQSSFTESPTIIENAFKLQIGNVQILAHKVFDSRPPAYEIPKKNQSFLLQSFYGFKIKTQTPAFDSSKMVMMDFNVPQSDFTQFMYILPYSEHEALVEFTRFGSKKLSQEESHPILHKYIENLGIDYTVLDEEKGVIPMSSANLITDNFGLNWVNMGAKANRLKCTTGYAFHAMAEDALFLADALKNAEPIKRKQFPQRFAFYDRLLLKILDEKPEFGKPIFETLFKKVPATKVLKFLKEKTSLHEEISIFSKLPKRLFVTAAIKDLVLGSKQWPVVALPFLFTIMAIILSFVHLDFIVWAILTLGFLGVGLPHGALDHLCSGPTISGRNLLIFMGNFILKGLALGLIWIFLPDLALLVFILYSAWHFGQADFREWQLKQDWHTMAWGFAVLLSILFTHFVELNWILNQIPNLKIDDFLILLNTKQIVWIQIFLLVIALLLSIRKQSRHMLMTVIYLWLATFLPLLLAFGVYFVFQHSLHGWRHLSSGLQAKNSTLWFKSLPFSLAGALIILLFIFSNSSNYMGVFFVVLSCLSMPHVLNMHKFYSKNRIEN